MPLRQSERQVKLVDIESILKSLGLDLTNPEVKRGAMEAIDAILGSRQPSMSMDGLGGMSGAEQDIEIDPDLLQPSIKNRPQENSDDIEIEDEEDLLKKVKHNDSDEPQESPMSNDSESGDSDDESSRSDDSQSGEGESSDNQQNNADESDSGAEDAQSDSAADAESGEESTEDAEGEVESSEEEAGQEASGESGTEEDEGEGEGESADGEEESEEAANGDSEDDGAASSASGEADENAEAAESDDESEIDEDDLLDDTLKDPYKDREQESKHEARRIKRERTLQAAHKALADAKAKNKTPALIRELEKAIEALESLQEAAAKKLSDMSDEEFNLIVNRVFDAIDALGDSGLTYSSDEERKLKAQEIKADLEDKQTQAELSAEDVAQIRAETQAIKAREKEKAKYQRRSSGSFKGFQDFLNSLYRAIALQVQTEENRDDTWSAISRRNSGAGVLQQGKKFNELPNRKIPVIDFYFDQSGSWGPDDIKVGNKAVQALMEMEEKGQIKINIYYFGNYVSTDPDDHGGGTSGWNEIVKNVIATQATNVVVMTDADMEDWWRPQDQAPLRYTVPGYVWYLWRYGLNAPRLPRDLKGRGGTQQFSFGNGDV